MKHIFQAFRVSFAAILTVALVLSFLPVAPLAAQATSVRYLVVAKADKLPDGLADQVTAAGGTISAVLPEIGVIAVESANPNFAATVKAIKGVQSVIPDVRVPWVTGQNLNFTGQSTAPLATDDDFLFPFQWNLQAIQAPQAWALGAKGRGVRVAVLDGGFVLEHPDFLWINAGAVVNNMDAASGYSFVDGEPLQFNTGLPVPSHATHVAGIIAAADNQMGVIGVAPEATIVPIKVLRDFDLDGDFAWIVQGIYYAANLQGAQAVQVINMSLGAAIPRDGYCDILDNCVTATQVAELVNTLKRAVQFAGKQGITVVAAAGNVFPGDPTQDMDHVGNLLFLPADIPGVITVSATGPVESANVDQLAFYSRYGQSFIDFAAPGGNSDTNFYLDFYYYGCNSSPLCAPISPYFPYPVGTLDWVWSTDGSIYGGWIPQVGTSMAAPHVAGVAALIIGQNGGHMKPAQVEAKLRQSADDLGKPGNDDFYGQGRVNAYNAVR